VLVFPDGIGAAYGLEEVGCPELRAADVLVLDATRAYLITRNDFTVDQSGDAFFTRDAWALRPRGRFAVGAPDMPKSLRKLNVAAARHEATSAKRS
jgi:hypothetical protein